MIQIALIFCNAEGKRIEEANYKYIDMCDSLKGIAGNAIQPVKELYLPGSEDSDKEYINQNIHPMTEIHRVSI